MQCPIRFRGSSVSVRKRLVMAAALAVLAPVLSGRGEDADRELGVYALCDYEKGWKGNVCVGGAYDPYYDFWKIMTTGSGGAKADSSRSARYRNSAVHIQNVLPIPNGKGYRFWDDFDLVFFYGHNNTIVPPHPDDSFGYSVYDKGQWITNSGALGQIGWGTPKAPYDYYARRPVKYAEFFPGAVTYLYYQYTSSLLGDPFDYGHGLIDVGDAAYRERWYSPLKTLDYGRLGNIDLEWLILHGCQAVIPYTIKGAAHSKLALKCFYPVHGRFHIVMGHYLSFYTTDLEPLAPFANDLLAGVPIQTAYFDVDPANNSSAIAAEKQPFTWATSTMANDRWSSPMADYPNAKTFSERWILPYGKTAQAWGP